MQPLLDYIPINQDTMIGLEVFCKESSRMLLVSTSLFTTGVVARSGIEIAELYLRGSPDIPIQIIPMVVSIAVTGYIALGLYLTKDRVMEGVDVQLLDLYNQAEGEKRGKLEEVSEGLRKLFDKDTTITREWCRQIVSSVSAANFPLDDLLQQLREYDREDARLNAEGERPNNQIHRIRARRLGEIFNDFVTNPQHG